MFNDLIKPFKEKLENILKFGSIKRVIGEDGKLQNLQIKTLRGLEKSLKMAQFGFNSKAPNESRIVVARIGNENVIISNEKIDKIIDISQGNTIVYNEMGNYVKVEDDTITLKAPNIISNCENFTINATTEFNLISPQVNVTASTNVDIETPKADFSAIVNVGGLLSALNYSGLTGSPMTTNVNLETTSDVVASGVSLVNHPHNQGNDSSGSVEVPTDAPTPTE